MAGVAELVVRPSAREDVFSDWSGIDARSSALASLASMGSGFPEGWADRRHDFQVPAVTGGRFGGLWAGR